MERNLIKERVNSLLEKVDELENNLRKLAKEKEYLDFVKIEGKLNTVDELFHEINIEGQIVDAQVDLNNIYKEMLYMRRMEENGFQVFFETIAGDKQRLILIDQEIKFMRENVIKKFPPITIFLDEGTETIDIYNWRGKKGKK